MKKIEFITLDKQISYVLSLQAIFLLLIGGAIFTGITEVNSLDISPIVGIGAYIVSILLHELLHGVGFALAGAKPTFGVGLVGIMPIAYATSEKQLNVKAMLIIAYLPFVSLSVFFIALALLSPGSQQFALIGFLGNFTGAVGDIWISSKLWKYVRIPELLVKDTKSGLEVYSDDKKAAAIAIRSKEKQAKNTRFLKQWAISTYILLGLQIILPIILAFVDLKENFKLGYGELYLFEINTSQDGASAGASFNLLAPIVLALIFTTILRIFENHNAKK